MDTNTMMLIVLAVLVVLSAVGIWLANRGSGVEAPPTDDTEEETEEVEDEVDTRNHEPA